MTKPEDKLFENIIDNLGKPKVKPKVKPKRVETMLERTERLTHLYDDAPKPKHFDDKSIVDMEKWNKMTGLEKKTPVIMKPKITRPKPFKSEDPSSYPMNQKKTLNTWETMLEIAKNPKTKEDREIANGYKRMINKDYYNPKMRGLLGDDELKFVGKHPSQRVKQPEIKIPTVDLNYKPYVPEPSGPSFKEIYKNSSRFKPGLSKDLLSINAEIKKNVDYVLGRKDEKSESENEKSQTNKEETYD